MCDRVAVKHFGNMLNFKYSNYSKNSPIVHIPDSKTLILKRLWAADAISPAGTYLPLPYVEFIAVKTSNARKILIHRRKIRDIDIDRQTDRQSDD